MPTVAYAAGWRCAACDAAAARDRTPTADDFADNNDRGTGRNVRAAGPVAARAGSLKPGVFDVVVDAWRRRASRSDDRPGIACVAEAWPSDLDDVINSMRMTPPTTASTGTLYVSYARVAVEISSDLGVINSMMPPTTSTSTPRVVCARGRRDLIRSRRD